MATINANETSKHFALLEELEASSKLIHLGFGELQNINQTNDFYFLPFQLLSQGFERLMKSYLCLGYLDKHNQYPEFSFIKDLGHDLEKNLKLILSDYFIVENHPTLISDKEFLTNNAELKELLYILSEFGKLARYHNFDIITGSKKPSVNTKSLWIKFHNRILFESEKMSNKILNWELNHEFYGELSRHVLIIFEKFVSALSRQFFFGGLGEKGKQFSIPFSDFAMLYEKDFGIKDYRQNTTRYRELPRKVHKRTLKDEIKRKYHPDYKSKRITKAEYEGEWPFYADEVIIECREKNWCVVTINGHDYALNGSAKGRYKLESPFDAGMAILGITLSDFTQMALELGKQPCS